MCERRIFIFKDHTGTVITRIQHHSSLIQSTPNIGDEIYDKCMYPNGKEDIISGIVQRLQFNYIDNTVVILVKIDS